jgi:hypothetical protein
VLSVQTDILSPPPSFLPQVFIPGDDIERFNATVDFAQKYRRQLPQSRAESILERRMSSFAAFR